MVVELCGLWFLFVYKARVVPFACQVHVYPVLLPIFFCVSWVFLVLQCITLAFDSMDSRLSSVWMRFLQLVVF